MSIRYSYSESHLRKRRPVSMVWCLFCLEAILRDGGLCLLLPTVVCPTRFAQHVPTRCFPARERGMSCAFSANFLPSQAVKLHAELLIFLHKVLYCRSSHLSSVHSLPTDDGRAVVKPLIVVLIFAQDEAEERQGSTKRLNQKFQNTKNAEKAPTPWPSLKGCATKRLEPDVIRSHHQLELQTSGRRWWPPMFELYL